MDGRNDPYQDRYEELKTFSKGMISKTMDKGRTGIFPMDSDMGKILMEEADHFGGLGDVCVKNGENRKAIEYYSKSIEAATQVKDNCILSTNVLYQRSCCFHRLGQYELAYQDALRCFYLGSPFMDGPLQIARSCVGLERYDEAVFWLLSGLGSYEQLQYKDAHLEYMNLCMEIVPKLTGVDMKLKKSLSDVDTRLLFGKSIEKIASYKNWKLVGMLWKHTPTRLLMASYVPGAVDLSEILQTVGSSWVDWGEDLVIELLERGADHMTLCTQSKYPYHAALKKGLKTGCFHMSEYLFKHHMTTAREARDHQGNTLYQVACSDKSPNKEKAISLISKYITVTPADGNKGPQQDAQHSTSERRAADHSQPAAERLAFVTDVHVWLEEYGLGQHKDKFQRSDGHLLEELGIIQETAPKAFFRLLGDQLDINAADILTFSKAIQNFSNKQNK